MSNIVYDPDYRPPMHLPQGSVRSLLALIIGGMFWLLLLFSDNADKIPLHVYFLLALLMLFVVSHNKTMAFKDSDVSNPFWLPRWFFRAVIAIGFIATLGWKLYDDPNQLLNYLTPEPEQLKYWPWYLAGLAGGFVLGRLLAAGPWQRSAMFRDLQAWIAVLATLGLGAEILIITVIDASMAQELNLPLWRSILTGIVACYFGIRS